MILDQKSLGSRPNRTTENQRVVRAKAYNSFYLHIICIQNQSKESLMACTLGK